MAYSYIPIGSTGEEYDHLACEVDNKLFFAGEVCTVKKVSSGGALCVKLQMDHNERAIKCLLIDTSHGQTPPVSSHFAMVPAT